MDKKYWRMTNRLEIHQVVDDKLSMNALRELFPNGDANEMNFVLFSTSGIHGTYQTIEEAESATHPSVTFLIVHPRAVAMRYGNVHPVTTDDFDFLKKLRASSQEVVSKIGMP